VTERIVVSKGAYHDSAFLMRVASRIKSLAGVEEAVVLMGTPMNQELLGEAGFKGAQIAQATPMDMVVAIRGASDKALDAAEKELATLLEGGSQSRSEAGGARAWRDLGEAAAAHPETNLVSISVPGAYAAYVAHRALDAGKHVFLFSNNVELTDEIALKKRGRELGLLVMGPDCGTAIISGVGQGFANRVPRGRIGLVGASGTGLQDVSCSVAHLGEGVSHAIGTGSRDLSKDVGGLMTEFGLRLLAEDDDTKVVALICKHPADEIADKMHGILRKLGKPTVVRYLGKPARKSEDGVFYAANLDEAANAAVALARGKKPTHVNLARQVADEAREILGKKAKLDGRMIGLFGGGSLCSEAKLILSDRGVDVTEPDHPLKTTGRVEEQGHLAVDTGEDFYTVGKPHPMVDQTLRCELIRKCGADPSVALILLDVVIGDGSNHDPAPELVAAVKDARKKRGSKPLVVLASITGTDADLQGAARQKAALEEGNVRVQPTAARAAMLAALLLGGAERSAR
jgi:succinyl-CoA synthetase alpha subunit